MIGFEEADKYISENFGLREQLVRMNAQVNVLGLDSSPNLEVVVGKDGWLFLSEDFQKKSISSKEWQKVAEDFARLDSELTPELIVVLVPNKSTLYSEFLPDRLSSRADGNYQKLAAELEKAGVNFIDLKEYFFDEKSGKELYSKGDTHWNRLGAFLAYGEIMNGLAIATAKMEDTFLYGRFGDLSRMVGLNEEEETWDIELPEKLVSEKKGRLLFFYDSFGEGLLPYLQRSFDSVNSVHVENFLTAKNEVNFGNNSDYIIVEIVERDLEEYLIGSAKGN